MNEASVIEVQRQALSAVECLSRVLNAAKGNYSDDEFRLLHKEVGMLIGQIQMGILEPIYEKFPELDDLAGK